MAQPGDLVACHSKGVVGRGIRFAQWVAREDCEYNHFAILDRPATGDDWYIIQAEAAGVTDDKLLSSVTPGGFHEIIPLPAELDAQDVLTFARAQVGRGYGFLTILSIAVTLLTPKFLNVMLPDTWICSAVAAESLRFAGWLHKWPDIYQVTPAQLYDALEVK